MKVQGNVVKLSQKTEIMEAWFFIKTTENSFWSLHFTYYWSSKGAIFFFCLMCDVVICTIVESVFLLQGWCAAIRPWSHFISWCPDIQLPDTTFNIKFFFLFLGRAKWSLRVDLNLKFNPTFNRVYPAKEAGWWLQLCGENSSNVPSLWYSKL